MTTTREVWGPTLSSKLSSNGLREARTVDVFPGGAKGTRTPDPHTASVNQGVPTRIAVSTLCPIMQVSDAPVCIYV